MVLDRELSRFMAFNLQEYLRMVDRRVVLIGLMLMLFILAGGVQAQEDAPVDQTLFMTFIPNIQFAPVYVALDKGYFEANGINLTIQHGDEPVGVDLIAANELQFGIVGGGEVIKARANGRPVVSVYQWFQEYPVGIVASVESGITTIADLAGRTVGIPGRFGESYNGLTALLAASGMTESDIQLQEIGFNAPEVVCVGGVEAAVVYINNEPLQIRQRAAQGDCGSITDVTVIPVSSLADLVSNALVTNEETMANNPELVQAVVSAFDAGVRDAINNPAEAYLLSAEYVENLPLDNTLRAALVQAAADQVDFLSADPDRTAITESRAALLTRLSEQFDAETLQQFQVLLNTVELWDAETPGATELSSWEVTQETLITMGFLTEPIELEGAFTNEFVNSLTGS
jgi:NitT/TauT family transport system substrate-binding protein